METTNTLPQKTERIEWIDALKGFAIFCVTLGHCAMYDPIEKYIYSFHMFLFFFISGFLFSAKRTTKQMLVSRTKRLLVPFLIWNSICALIGFYFTGDRFALIKELFVLEGKLTWNAPLWFLLVSFIVQLIFISLKLYKRTDVCALTVVACLALWIKFGKGWVLWKFNLVPMGLAFFALGYLCKEIVPFAKKWYVIILSGIGSIYFALNNIRIVYTYGKFGNYSVCILAAICGVIFFVGLFSCMKIPAFLRFLNVWGKNSLLIMALQYFVFRAITFASKRYLEFDLMKYKSSATSLAITLFTMLIISLLIFVLKKATYRVKPLKKIGEAFGVQY